jgi:hypothetical protein
MVFMYAPDAAEVMKMNEIRTEEELIEEMRCSDLCFIKGKVKAKELVEDRIHDDECPC